MDFTVSARFFRVNTAEAGIADFPEILLSEMLKSRSARERDVTGTGHTLRLEQCENDGEFVCGEFCRKQTSNIPPQAGPEGLSPINLPNGQGLGHLAAFRYHRPTRVVLLQNNVQCATASRVSAYITKTNAGAVYALTPIFREDALERFKNRKVRSFTVGFASPANLEALDDKGLASAKGARMLAEAFNGLDLTITVSVGKKRKKFLDFGSVQAEIAGLLSSNADLNQLEVSADQDEEGSGIDFLQEQLRCRQTLDLPEGDHSKHYAVRAAFLKSEFSTRMPYLLKHFGAQNGNTR